MGSRLINVIGTRGASLRVALRVYLQTVRGGVWTRNESNRTRFGFNPAQRAIWDNLKIGEHFALFIRGKSRFGVPESRRIGATKPAPTPLGESAGFMLPTHEKEANEKSASIPPSFEEESWHGLDASAAVRWGSFDSRASGPAVSDALGTESTVVVSHSPATLASFSS